MSKIFTPPPPFNNPDFVLLKSTTIEVPLSPGNETAVRRIKVGIVATWRHLLPAECIEVLKQDGALLLGKLGAELVIKHAPSDFVPQHPWWIASFSEHHEVEINGVTDPLSKSVPKRTKRNRDRMNLHGVGYFFWFNDVDE